MRTCVVVLSLIVFGALAFGQNGEEAKQARYELEITDRLIERAEPLIVESGNEEAVRLLTEAKDLQRDAWREFNQQRYRMAKGLTNLARYRVKQALELIAVDSQKVAEEIRRTAEVLDEVGPVIKRAGIKEAEEVFRLALGEQETARRYFDGKRYALALRFTRAGRQHAKKALEMVRRRGDRERIEAELKRTDELLARAKEKMSSGLADRREQFERAAALQKQAHEAFGQSRFVPALRLTLAARGVLLRFWESGPGAADPELTAAAAEENDRLIANWSAAIEADGPNEARALLKLAKEQQARVRARIAAREYGPAYREANQARRTLNRAIEILEASPSDR